METKVTTALTFHEGRLVPAGVPIRIDPNVVDMTGNTDNLADMGKVNVLRPVEVAAIGPSGPNPTMPQQVPPGVFQTTAGYAVDGQLLVGETSNATPASGVVEEEAPVRRQPLDDAERAELDAFRAREQAAGNGGAPTEETGEDDAFDPAPIIAGTVPELTSALDGLTLQQLAAVRAAEVDRDNPRTTALDAIDEAIKAKG